MKKITLSLFFSSLFLFVNAQHLRGLADTIGFAHTARQMNIFMERLGINNSVNQEESFRLLISPHDDYTYVGPLYPQVLKHVKTKTVILFGVAHKAKKYNLENKLIFDDFEAWQGPYKNIKISPLRKEIMKALPANSFIVHDSMQVTEHSVEAILPFLQFYNKDIEIIPILIPYMSLELMASLSTQLAKSIEEVANKHKLIWGKDFSLVISTDAVHYGDEEWAGRNFARFGTDSTGYKKAVAFEHEIIDNCLKDDVQFEKIKKFTQYTLKPEDYKEYLWTWCGRYSIPFGMLTAKHLQQDLKATPLSGQLIGYSNSLDHPHIPVKDLGMGETAPASLHHWVGYVGMGFK